LSGTWTEPSWCQFINSFATGLCINSGGESNNKVGGCFHPISHNLPLTALMTRFVQMIDMVMGSCALLINSFFPADFLQPWLMR
jgi:hypothetical protein